MTSILCRCIQQTIIGFLVLFLCGGLLPYGFSEAQKPQGEVQLGISGGRYGHTLLGEPHGDLVSRLKMGTMMVTIWVIGVITLLTKSP